MNNSETLQLKDDNEDLVVISILAKDKALVLPIYLKCISNQTYPKNKTIIYIRTNDNNDNTADILQKWVKENRNKYHSIKYDDTSINPDVKKIAHYEWDSTRLEVIKSIRQTSIQFAIDNKAHYFVVDCDNFIAPFTLQNLMNTRLEVIGPFLPRVTTVYANYHNQVDENGYFKDNKLYYEIFSKNIKGLINVDVIHSTYLIRNHILNKIKYIDESTRHEYVIFSNHLRNFHIPQYLDNRYEYGRLIFAENSEDLEKEGITHFHDKCTIPLKFVHIPKTGGCKITNAGQNILMNWGFYDHLLYDNYPKEISIPINHIPLRKFKPEFLATYKSDFKLFTVVRNPYTRLISVACYHYLSSGLTKDQLLPSRLNEFIKLNLLKNHYEGNLEGHLIPQYEFCYDQHNQKIVDHILKFENLKEEFNSLMKEYNISLGIDDELFNQTNSNQIYSIEDLENDTIELIDEYYNYDFNYFGYEKKLITKLTNI